MIIENRKPIWYKTLNKTRLEKSGYKQPFYDKSSTEKQKIKLKKLLHKTGFCDNNGKLKDFAESLPYGEKQDNQSANEWLDKLTTFQASTLIQVLRI